MLQQFRLHIGPIVKRSALALPKPSSEGLSKQLWYSGPVNQMNRQKTKTDTGNELMGGIQRTLFKCDIVITCVVIIVVAFVL